MRIPLAKTGIYACGVLHQTGVASAKPDTVKQENSMARVDLYRLLLAELNANKVIVKGQESYSHVLACRNCFKLISEMP